MLNSALVRLRSRSHLKLDADKILLFHRYHTSTVLRKKKQKSRLEIFKDKIVYPEDLDKRPSELEIRSKDLPINQPTLEERIDRDEHNYFFQKDEKHGYHTRKPTTITEDLKMGLKKNPKKLFMQSVGAVKDEFVKLREEVKEGEYSLHTQLIKNTIYPGDRCREWGFQSEVELDEWIVTADSDWGEGYSSTQLKLNDAGTAAVWSGDLSTRVPNDGRTDQAGYVNIASVNKRKSFGRRKLLEHWDHYTHLTMNVRGDGRKYIINLKPYNEFDMLWDDRWHFPLYTRGGPYWQYVKIPFSKFFLGHKGYIQDKQHPLVLVRMQGMSITLKDRITGPYRLEIKDVSLHNDPFGDDEEFAYELYEVPDFWIGGP